MQQAEGLSMQVVEESVADDDMVMIRGSSNGAAVSVLLRGANDYMLDEMDRSLHDAFCVVKRVLESGKVVPGAQASGIPALKPMASAIGPPMHTLTSPVAPAPCRTISTAGFECMRHARAMLGVP